MVNWTSNQFENGLLERIIFVIIVSFVVVEQSKGNETDRRVGPGADALFLQVVHGVIIVVQRDGEVNVVIATILRLDPNWIAYSQKLERIGQYFLHIIHFGGGRRSTQIVVVLCLKARRKRYGAPILVPRAYPVRSLCHCHRRRPSCTGNFAHVARAPPSVWSPQSKRRREAFPLGQS